MTEKNNNILYNCIETRKVTMIGMILNLILTVFKILTGYFGNSSSTIADGVHSLSDVSTDIAILIGVKYWNQPPDEDHPYGHRRIEAMISVFIGIILGAAGLFLAWNAVLKLYKHEYLIPEKMTLIVAVASIIIKEWLFRWTNKVGKKIKSRAIIANAWHHRSDSISSIPVAIAISLAIYNPLWAFIDPIATLAVSAFIIQAAFNISLPSLKELSDTGADKNSIKVIENIILKIEGIKSVHSVRSRYHGAELYVDLHIQVDGNLTVTEGHNISGIAKKRLIVEGPDITDVLIHLEPYEK